MNEVLRPRAGALENFRFVAKAPGLRPGQKRKTHARIQSPDHRCTCRPHWPVSFRSLGFYEEKGLVEPFQSSGGQRRFLRSDIRRLSFVLIAQQLGLRIGEIEHQLAKLPHGRTPT